MKTKIKKILIIVILLIIALSILSQVFAISATDITSNFSGSTGTSLQGGQSVKKIIGGILDAVRIASAGIAIIMLSVLAVKYMVSSPNERADIKNGAILYVIGAIVMMAASYIVGIIRDFTTNNIQTTTTTE
jgi:hypothetical protein